MTHHSGRILTILLTACLCIIGGCRRAYGHGVPASTYYVANDGNDGWSGTLPAPNQQHTDGPFKTLARAQQAVELAKNGATSPITVEVRRGTYYLEAPLSFTAKDSGTSALPITWEGYPGDPQPVISGGQRLTGWKNAAGNLWTLTLPSTFQNFEALYYNNERRLRPRTTRSYLNLNPVIVSSSQTNCTEPFEGGYRCADRFSFHPGDLASSYHDITDVEIISFEDWTVSRMRLQSVDTTGDIAYLTGLVASGNYFGFLPGHRYLVENTLENLTQPGQWYLDRGTSPWTLSYLAKYGEDPNSDAVIVPQQTQLLVAKGLEYVTFQNLTFAHDDYTVPAAGHSGETGETGVPAAVSFTDSSDITMSGVSIAHTQEWALEFVGTAEPGQGNTVTASLFYDLGTGGIRLGQLPRQHDTDSTVAQNNDVDNSMIFGGGRFLPSGQGTGIWMGSSHNNTLTHNDVHDFYTGAIELGQSPRGDTAYTHDNVIEYNALYELGQGVTSDMGCVHASSGNNAGNQILNNVCHDVIHDQSGTGYGGDGIYIDNSTDNVTVENNLVYRLSDSALFVNDGAAGDTITNNIFSLGREGMLRRGTTEGAGSFIATHNIFYYDIGALQKVPANWSCTTYCMQQFSMDYHTYWNSLGTAPVFVTTVPGNPNEVSGQYTLAEWQTATSEDVHSQNSNPGFVDPVYPADDYSFTGQPPSGFVPFSTSDVGPTVPLHVPPTPMTVAFPLQLLNRLTGF